MERFGFKTCEEYIKQVEQIEKIKKPAREQRHGFNLKSVPFLVLGAGIEHTKAS